MSTTIVKRNNNLAWSTLLFSIVLHVLVAVAISMHSLRFKEATQPPAGRVPTQVLWLVKSPATVKSPVSASLKLPAKSSSPARASVRNDRVPLPSTPIARSPSPPATASKSASASPEEGSHSSTLPAATLYHARPDYAYNPAPDYPIILRERGIGGTVWLQVWVGSDGLPGEIRVTQGSGVRLLDESASRAVRYWRFIPARRGNHHIASWVEFPIRFALSG